MATLSEALRGNQNAAGPHTMTKIRSKAADLVDSAKSGLDSGLKKLGDVKDDAVMMGKFAKNDIKEAAGKAGVAIKRAAGNVKDDAVMMGKFAKNDVKAAAGKAGVVIKSAAGRVKDDAVMMGKFAKNDAKAAAGKAGVAIKSAGNSAKIAVAAKVRPYTKAGKAAEANSAVQKSSFLKSERGQQNKDNAVGDKVNAAVSTAGRGIRNFLRKTANPGK